MSRRRSHHRQSRTSSDQIEGLRLKPCSARRMAGFMGHAELPSGWVYLRRRLILKFAACALTNINSNKETQKGKEDKRQRSTCAFSWPKLHHQRSSDNEVWPSFDRNTITKENNLASALAFAFSPSRDGRTVVCGEVLVL